MSEDDDLIDLPGESLVMDAFLEAEERLSKLLDEQKVTDEQLEAIYLKWRAKNGPDDSNKDLSALEIWMEVQPMMKLVFRTVKAKMDEAGCTEWCLNHDCDPKDCPPDEEELEYENIAKWARPGSVSGPN